MRLRCRSACLLGVCALASALGPVLLKAQTVPRPPATRDSVARLQRDSLAQYLDRVVVRDQAGRPTEYAFRKSFTATRTPTMLRDVPQSVSVVTRALIADQAMQSMADVVRAIPGVTIGLGEGHRDAPTIRGVSSTADFFLDGVRDDAQYLRDLYNTDRVEVLKGANAMAFGRGGGGGIINRVSREAQWLPARALTLEGGSFAHQRATVDVGNGVGRYVAARLNGVYENSGGFRDAVGLERTGVNPLIALHPAERTVLHAGYEYFEDRRTVDRGVPSYTGRPSAAPVTAFFGDPAGNRSRVRVNAATATVEQSGDGFTIRNRTRVADYDKFYRNVYPGALNSAGTLVTLQAYDHAIGRRNVFNQTDLTMKARTGPVTHTVLLGAEAGLQRTEQLRNTGYFNGTATSITTPFAARLFTTPVTYRQSATDADSWSTAHATSAYVQDQLSLHNRLELVAGLRYERFRVRYHNNRTGAELSRNDVLLSPRAGIVVKPVTPIAVYGSYSVSYLPSSGEQFTTLTVTSQALEPERFTNREVGFKWDATPALMITSALFRLDRTNTSAPDPADATRTVQTGAQRTNGYELGATGNLTRSWQIAAGVASQRARIVSTTTSAKRGATVPLVPHTTVSLWNRYDLSRAAGLGLGVVHQAEMFAAIDNTVRLPPFTRLDGALFLTVGHGLRAQANVENVLNTRYYPTSHGNNNIMPGATRTVRVSVSMGRRP